MQTKDPNAITDHGADFSERLAAGVTIASATVEASADLTISAVAHDDSLVTFRVAGGVHGKTYPLRVIAVLSTGETDEQTFPLVMLNG